MKVEVLREGCAKCNKLYDMVTGLVKDRGIDPNVASASRNVRGSTQDN